jgi:uncharacterized protein YdaU (DUF1376 family)
MSAVNFYKKHIGAYAKKTPHLSLMEHGAYNLLMDACYANEGPLPADKQSLYKICRATSGPERKAVNRVADEFFPVNGDGRRHNERCDEELESYRKKCDTNRGTAIAREAARKEHAQSTKRATTGSTTDSTKGGTNDQPNSEFRKNLKEGANAPPDPLWGDGLKILTDAGGSIESARTLIGKWLKDWSASDVSDALQESRGTANPKAYAFKLLSSKQKKHGRGGSDPLAGAV